MKVLALIEGDNAVCCRYRIEGFGRAMAERGMSLEVVRFNKGVIGRIGNLRKAKSADVVILQRKLLPIWQMRLLRRWSRRLIFDFDDAIYQRDSNSGKGPESRLRLMKFRAIVSKADAVIAGNEYLRQAACIWTEPRRVHCIPNCIDMTKYRMSKHVRVGAEARLVWIGQQSTLRTLGTAAEQLSVVARTIPGMEFWQICDRSAEFPGLRVVLRPWSITTEVEDLSEGDIGIAWMPDDCWSLGKCGLKILQYMAAGLPVVANPVGIHREVIIHGETGFLATTPDQWAESAARLAADPQLRKKFGEAGRYLVEKRFSVSTWETEFVEALQGSV